MQIQYGDVFKKRFQKLQPKIQVKFEERITLFIKDPQSKILKVHPLKGTLVGFRAFSVTGDYRVIYKITSTTSIKLIDIGKHGQIYN